MSVELTRNGDAAVITLNRPQAFKRFCSFEIVEKLAMPLTKPHLLMPGQSYSPAPATRHFVPEPTSRSLGAEHKFYAGRYGQRAGDVCRGFACPSCPHKRVRLRWRP